MNLSPLDIRKHEFKKSMRGYDVEEVAAFLDLVSMEYENFVRDNSMLQQKANEYTTQLKKYHDIESILQETLLSAERAREETVITAKKQADVIIREAEVKAASIMEEGRREFSRLRNSITELKIQKEAYSSKIKALINAQLEIFEKVSFHEEEKFENIASSFGEEKDSRKVLNVLNQNSLKPDKPADKK